MLNIIVYTVIIISFFNFGFVSVLQRLMHYVDDDPDQLNVNPWREELIYVAYYLVIVVILLWLARSTSQMETTMIMLNCQVLIMISLTNALKTLPGILTGTITTFVLYGLFFPVNMNIQMIAGMILFIIYLVIENRYFAYFDKNPLIHLLVKTLCGCFFWLNVLIVTPMANDLQIAVFISYIGTSLLNFGYMYVLNREHVRNMNNAHNVYHDSLTNARNWLSYTKEAEEQFTASKRKADFGIIAMDIDHFKSINDTYGHTAGNRALRAFVNAINKVLAPEGKNYMLFRTGGEEFTIICAHTTAAEAERVAQRCQQAIQEITIKTDADQEITFTASMGLAMMRLSDHDQKDVFRRADNYLYNSKHAGRNQITTDDRRVI